METNYDKISKILDELNIPIHLSFIHPDGTVDVHHSVNLRIGKLDKLPLKFGEILGSFFITRGNLTTLEGCPHTVQNTFSCSQNKITTLQGGPTTVGGDYICSWNELTDLVGAPTQVNRFECEFNQLESLKGLPNEIRGSLGMGGNKLLYNPDGIRFATIGGTILYDVESTTLSPPFASISSKFASIEDFQQSLDYDYLKFDGSKWKISRFKWEEACAEFDLDPPKVIFGYEFL